MDKILGFGGIPRPNKLAATKLLFDNVLQNAGTVNRMFELPGDALVSTDIFKKLFWEQTDEAKYSHIYATEREPEIYNTIRQKNRNIHMPPKPMSDLEALTLFHKDGGPFDLVVLDYCGSFCDGTAATFDQIFTYDIIRHLGLLYFCIHSTRYQPPKVLRAFEAMHRLKSFHAGRVCNVATAACYYLMYTAVKSCYAAEPIFHTSYKASQSMVMQINGFRLHKFDNIVDAIVNTNKYVSDIDAMLMEV